MNTQTTSLKAVSQRNFCTMIAIAVAVFAVIAITACKHGTNATSKGSVNNYAEDRALIEDLQARYMFALDFGDLDKYVATFTEDGILDIGEGEWKGRDTIRKVIAAMPKPAADTSKLPPPAGRHCIANIVLKIEGDTAYGRAYWFHMSNSNPQRSATLDCYGHYEDVMVKVNGTWLFSKRRIFNEQNARWVAPGNNPGW